NSDVYALWNALQAYGLRNSLEIRDTMGRFKNEWFDKVDYITAEEIFDNDPMDNPFFLDVRPKREFEKESIANAKSIPIEQLKDSLSQLPKDRQIVVYCRGPLCVFADEAVQYLRERGYDAIRLQEEVKEWKQKGYPIN
ncbi:MAG: rhodanese-like domain-containing protein, partial [Flavobacteriaceae bacterium]